MGIADVWNSPEQFPIRIEPWNNKVVFVPLTRDMYRSLAFLDDRYIPMSASWETSLDEVATTSRRGAAHSRRPVQTIFHIAFCGSTLISRCLDRLSGALVLKEPFPLHDIGFLKRHDSRMHSHPEAWRTSFDLLMRLLGRTYEEDQVSIAKPTDASTHLIGDVLSYSPVSAALFLYVDLESFLASMLVDATRRGFARDRLDDLSIVYPNHPLFGSDSRDGLTDAESAACLWMLHTQIYLDFVARCPDTRCRSLDFATFLEHPVGTLHALARLFDVASDTGEIARAIDAEMSTHSKERDTPFTYIDRARALRTTAETYRDEIAAGLAWATRTRADWARPAVLPRALEGTGKRGD